MYQSISIISGWLLDKLLGDPSWLPHPVVLFGRVISIGERRLNRGSNKRLKGGVLAVSLTVITFVVTSVLLWSLRQIPVAGVVDISVAVFSAIAIFFCLAGTTLCREVRMVFEAADRSLDEGRTQVARIVGRDTSGLSGQEVRKAALETLAENLSDGVIAPLFWLALLGVPGMMAYKMVNTLDSMIAYRTERYREFGTVAARIDDAANYIPARLTALIMIIVAGKPQLAGFVMSHGPRHISPNSGWPEAALAGILGCRFGGAHSYFGETVDKPFIGNNERPIDSRDMKRAIRVNQTAEVVAIIIILLISWPIAISPLYIF